MTIETPRLRLRPWETRDLAPFAALNADPEVMRYFPKLMNREESDALVGRIVGRTERDGFGFSVAERLSDGAFLGMVGISRVGLPGTIVDGMVEAGWRLARASWGQGYATEGAAAAISHAFATLDLPEIVAFTAVPNLPSQAVMRRLGMRRAERLDFDHPVIPEDSPLRRHVSFTLARADSKAHP